MQVNEEKFEEILKEHADEEQRRIEEQQLMAAYEKSTASKKFVF